MYYYNIGWVFPYILVTEVLDYFKPDSVVFYINIHLLYLNFSQGY